MFLQNKISFCFKNVTSVVLNWWNLFTEREQEALEELREEEEVLLPYLREQELEKEQEEQQRYLEDNAIPYPAENYDPELLERMSRNYYNQYDVMRNADGGDYYQGLQ